MSLLPTLEQVFQDPELARTAFENGATFRYFFHIAASNNLINVKSIRRLSTMQRYFERHLKT